jgi:TrpR-related protein YerC/YecD
MITEKEKKNLQQFYRAILALEDEEECRKFFDDVATIKEALDLSARLEVARLLDEGVVFSEISKATGASSATISRVNKCLTYGEGGYRTVLGRIAGGNGKDK